MVRIKKCFVFLLVFVMILSTFSLSVSAAVIDEDTISPYATTLPCPSCGRVSRVIHVHKQTTQVVEPACKYSTAIAHTHEYRIYDTYINCTSCGRERIGGYRDVYCGNNFVRTDALN